MFIKAISQRDIRKRSWVIYLRAWNHELKTIMVNGGMWIVETVD